MKENRTPGDESGGQENVFRPPPLNSRLWLTPPPSLPPVNPLASLFYLSFPLCHSLPSHLLMRSFAYTCALTISLFLSLPLSGDCSASHPRSLAASSVFLPPGRRNTRSPSNGPPPTPLHASLKYQAPSTAHFPTCLGAWSLSALL